MTTEKRAQRYPVIVTQPLGGYIVEHFDYRDRRDRGASALADAVRETIGVDVSVAPVKMTPANSGGETWTVAMYAAMFTNVTRSELEGYAEKLSDVLTGDEPSRRLISVDGMKLPEPDIFVPDREWIERETREAKSLSERGKGLLNPDGTINTDAARERGKQVADEARNASAAQAKAEALGGEAAERDDGTYAEAADLF